MINRTLKKQNRQWIPWGLGLICAVFLGFGCNESIGSDSLNSESSFGAQTDETDPYGAAEGQVVHSNVNDESQQNAPLNAESQADSDFHRTNPEDNIHEGSESGNDPDDADNIHLGSAHADHLQIAADETDIQSDSGDDDDANPISPDSESEISEPGNNEDAASDAETQHTHDWAQPIEAAGLPNLFKVSEEVYRSAQPESGGFESAEKLGIKTILSVRLTANDAVLAESEPTSMTLIHIPVAPVYITADEMLEVMKAFDGAEKPILVHCLHGADRTGLTIALYRILYEHWSKEEAKDELVNGGFGYHTALTNIPDFIDSLDIDSFTSQLFGD